VLGFFVTLIVASVVLKPVTTVSAPPQIRQFQLTQRFSIELDGVMLPAVQSVDGLQDSVNLYRSSTSDWLPQKLPGRQKPPVITLHRGLTTDNSLFEWRLQVLHGNAIRKTAALHTFSQQGRQETFTFGGCLPTKYQKSAAGEITELSCESETVAVT